MRLAKSQAHQPFPGFFKPGFLLSNHRCKSLFQSVCPDLNRAVSLFRQMHSASALFERRFFWLAAVFFLRKNYKDSGAVLLVLTDWESGALFHFKKGAGRSACIWRPEQSCSGLIFYAREELHEHQHRRKGPLPQRNGNRPCPRRISDGQNWYRQASCPAWRCAAVRGDRERRHHLPKWRH